MPKDIPKMPDGLEDLLRGLSKAVLKQKPQNILYFSAKYFENLLIERDGSLMKNYERFEKYEKNLKKSIKLKFNGDDDGAKKNVKSANKNRKTISNPIPVKSSEDKNENVPSPIFGDKVVEKEQTRKSMEAQLPRGKLKTRARSSISLNAITEESNSEMKEERRLMYRNAVQKIQRAFRRYMETKKQNSPALEAAENNSKPPEPMEEDKAAKIIQNLFKLKFPKKPPSPQQRPRSIKNKKLEGVAEGGEDNKSLLDYLQEEENAKKTRPNIEHDSDTGETLTTRVDDAMKISKADSLENMIINEDMNRQLNSKTPTKDQDQAAIKIQSTFRGHRARKQIKKERGDEQKTTAPPVSAATIQETVMHNKTQGEMEQAAVNIQKTYRGYKVRKDILSAKNVVNSGNLVAAAGNIIGSVVNHLSLRDLQSNSVNDGIISEVKEIHGTVAQTPEFLNKEVDEATKLTDPVITTNLADSIDTNLDKPISSPVHEVSQNTALDIEPVIGINEPKHDIKSNQISNDSSGKTTEIPEAAVIENTPSHVTSKGEELFIGVDEPKMEIKSIAQAATTPENNLVLDVQRLNGTTKEIDSQVNFQDIAEASTHQNPKAYDADTVEPKHVMNPIVIDEITESLNAPHDSNKIRTESAGEIQEIQEAGTVIPQQEIMPLESDAVAIQNHSIFDGPPNNLEIISEGINTVKSKLVTEPLAVDATTDQNNSAIETPGTSEEIRTEPEDVLKPASNDESVLQTHPALDDSINIPVPGAADPLGLETLDMATDDKNHQILDEPHGSAETKILATDATSLENHPVLDAPHNSAEIITLQNPLVPGDPFVTDIQRQQEAGTVENKHEPQHLAPDAGVLDGPLTNPAIKTDDKIQDLDIVEPKRDINLLATEAANHQNSLANDASLNSEETTSNLPDEIQLVPQSATVSSNNETESVFTNSTSHGDQQLTFRTQDSLPDLDDPEMADAAVKIQKSFRSHQARKETRPKQTEQVHIIPEVTVDGAREEILSDSEPVDDNPKAPMKSELVANQEIGPGINSPEANEAAVKIQKTFRGYQTRKTLKENKANVIPAENQLSDNPALSPQIVPSDTVLDHHHNAAVKIQKTYRGHQVRKELKQKRSELVNTAALVGNSTTGDNLNPANLMESTIKSEIDQEFSNQLETQENNLPGLNDPENIDTENDTKANYTSEPEVEPTDHAEAAIKSELGSNKPDQAVIADIVEPEKVDVQLQETTSNSINVVGPEDVVSAINPLPIDSIITPSEDGTTNNNVAPEHQDNLPDLNDPEMADAALKIQKSFRGHQARKDVTNIRKKRSLDFKEDGSENIIEALPTPIEENYSLKSEITHPDLKDVMSTTMEHQDSLLDLNDPNMAVAEVNIQKSVEPLNEVADGDLVDTLTEQQNPVTEIATIRNSIPMEHQESLPDLNDPEMADATLKIQKSFRGHQARKEQKKPENDTISKHNSNVENISLLPDTVDLPGTKVEDNPQITTVAENSDKLQLTESQDSLPDLNDPEMADAALKIQKSFRGHQARRDLKKQKSNKSEESVDPALDTENLASNQDSLVNLPDSKMVEEPSENSIVAANQQEIKSDKSAMEREGSLPDLNDPEMADAAAKIQKSFRGHQARKEQKKLENQTISKAEPVVDNLIGAQDQSTAQNKGETLSDLLVPEPEVTVSQITTNADNQGLPDSSSPTAHQDSLPDLNDPEMADAAVKIQKSFRGHQARKEQKQLNGVMSNTATEISLSDVSATELDDVGPKLTTAADNETLAQPVSNQNEHQDSLPGLNDPEMDAAVRIQKSDKQMAAQYQEGVIPSIASDSILSNIPGIVGADVKENLVEPLSNQIEHKDSLPDLNDPEMENAAIKIQKSFRGHQVRAQKSENKIDNPEESVAPEPDITNTQEILADSTESTMISPIHNGAENKPQVEHQDSLPDLNDPEMAAAAMTIQKSFRGHKARKEATKPIAIENATVVATPDDTKHGSPSLIENQDSLPDLTDPEMADAALKIQKSFRGHKARKEFKENQENIAIDKILSGATAPPADEPTSIMSSSGNIDPNLIAKVAETAAINIQRTYRGYRTRRDLKSQNPPLLGATKFEDDNKLVDSLEPILDQKSDEDKIDADSLDNFNVDEKSEVVEEPCQKIVYKSKLSMLIENSKSESSSDKVEPKPNDDYFDSLENGQTSELDESAQTVIEARRPSSSFDGQNTYDSSIFGLKIEPDNEQHEEQEVDSMSRKTTAEVDVPDAKVEARRRGMTNDEIEEIQNVDLSSFDKDSLEAMYYSLRKNELLLDQMHSMSNVEQISDQTEPPRQFTAKQKLMSMGESDSDDIVYKQLSIDFDEYSEASRQHTARSTTDDDADVEVVRNVLYYNDGKQILSNSGEVKREPGDGASVASDNLFDNHSNAEDYQEILTKTRAHQFEIFSLDEEIKNLESNVAPHQKDNPLFYAQQKIEKFLHQIHGNEVNEAEDDADDENDDEFLENPIDSNKSYLSENKFNIADEEEDDVVDELRNDFRETSARKLLASAVSEADSDYIEQSRANKPIKDDFNISTALDNYYLSTDSDSTYNSAATKIQAGARGFLTRRRIQSINRQSISERRSSIGNAAIDQSLDDMIEENEERKKFKFHEAQSTFREDTITSSGEMEMYGITDIKVEEKKTPSPITDSGNESTTSIDTETQQSHLRNKYDRLENESSFDAIDEDNLSDVVDVIRTSNVQNKLRSPMKNKTLSNINFDEYDRVATRRMTLQRGNAVQGNSTPSDDESRSNPSGSSTATTNSEEKSEQQEIIDNKNKTSYDSPIRRKSTDSASILAKSTNSLPDMQNLPKKRGFIQRQRTMPVQIETEIIRPLPKHMRKRIKSANSSAHASYHASKKKTSY